MGEANRLVEAETVAPEVGFGTLYEREFSYVWRTLQRLGIPRRDLEDAAHDVLVVAYRRRADYDTSRPLRPWLFGIAIRVVQEYRRGARSDEPLDERPDPPDLSRGPEEQVAALQGRRVVIEMLAKLDADKRAVLILHDIDGESVPQIAHALGIPLNTAYSRLRLARADLAAEICRIRERHGGK